MGKYFFKQEDRHGDNVILTGNTAHHMRHVMRLDINSEVILCDGNSNDYIAKLDSFTEKPLMLTFKLMAPRPCTSEFLHPITLYQGLPKNDKMNSIIEKCIEVGVTTIVPVCTMRSVVKVKDATKKAERYSKIAESAASQSMRGIIPLVCEPESFDKALKRCSNTLTLIAYENEREVSIKTVLTKHPPQPISIWIGPEGGFDVTEVIALKNTGAVQISLGPRILRTETAGIVAIAQILNTWDGY